MKFVIGTIDENRIKRGDTNRRKRIEVTIDKDREARKRGKNC